MALSPNRVALLVGGSLTTRAGWGEDRLAWILISLFVRGSSRPHYSFKCPCGIVANRWKFLVQLMTDKLIHHISSCCRRLAWAGKPRNLADVLCLALAHDSMVINSHYSAWRLLYVVLLVWLVAVQIFFSVHLFICATPILFPRESGPNSPLANHLK